MNQVERPLNALLVDDDEFTVEFVADMLRHVRPCTLRTAGSAAGALEHLRDEAPDILFCDLNMPGMDGIELLRHVAAGGFRGGVVLLSGMDGKLLKAAESLANAQHLNIVGSLSKPVNEENLRAVLERFDSARSCLADETSVEALTASELIKGLASGCLRLHVQPKISLHNAEVVGVECLARWEHPTRGTLLPDTFIAVAEQSGMIDALTLDMLHMGAQQLRQWKNAGLALRISVNVSMDNLHELDQPEIFADIVARAGLTPQDITLEITESRLISDYTVRLDILTRLRLKGFGLSIDDFGTGYSTLEKIKQLPFTELKVDRYFVHGANHDPAARAILESSVRLGRSLQLNVVAEGVENEEDWNLAMHAGCHEVQGYHVAEAMPAEEFADWLANWQSTHPAATGTTPAEAGETACTGGNLLIVDDDDCILDGYRAALQPQFQVTTAHTGLETLAIAKNEKPDLIILDVEIPGIDGFETCRRLRSLDQTANTPVIFVSASDRIERRIAGYEAGGNDYLTKPFDIKELTAKIAQQIQAAAERSQLKQMADFAGQTAMTAMSNLGEMGSLIQTLQRFNACATYDELAGAVIDGLSGYGLSGAVRVSAGEDVLARNSKGDSNPLEISVLEHMSAMDRIVQFKNRMSISYDHVDLLVTDMPLDNPDLCGRLRDHLTTLTEGANVRARAIYVATHAQRQSQGIEKTIGKIIRALADIDQAQRKSRVLTNLSIQKLNASVEQTLLKMALTEEHEALMIRVVAAGVENILVAQSSETDVQDGFTDIVNELKGFVAPLA